VINFPNNTEGQPSQEERVSQGNYVGENPAQCKQQGTDLGAHDSGVVQRMANGHIAVICHYSQEKAVQITKHQEEVHLCEAASIGDGMVLSLHIHKHFGNCGGC
jgi:hypothetical protein